MIVSSPADYRTIACRKLPAFLFHYISDGSFDEVTLRRNTEDLSQVELEQRVLRDVSSVDVSVEIFGERLAMPLGLGPVGLTGMYSRRGEVKAALAADAFGIPFTMSSVSVCPIEEVTAVIRRPMWFQLYVLKDRGFMKNVLERAQAAGVTTLVFTVDLAATGIRYGETRFGLNGPHAALRRFFQILGRPAWLWDVGFLGRPHDLGNITKYWGKARGLGDYDSWLEENFDPSISLKDLDWIRSFWKGNLVIKGILNPRDALDAAHFGADGVVVSNHGGRQLDGVSSTIRALPAIADAVGGDIKVLMDSGIRSGLDVIRAVALGADMVLLGRAYAYALAAHGKRGVARLLAMFEREIRVAMMLAGVSRIANLDRSCVRVFPK